VFYYRSYNDNYFLSSAAALAAVSTAFAALSAAVAGATVVLFGFRTSAELLQAAKMAAAAKMANTFSLYLLF
jgi:hypothetical protein